MAVSSWLPGVGTVEAGAKRFHAFLDNVIRELHLRKDDPEQINALAHDLNLSRNDIGDTVVSSGEELLRAEKEAEEREESAKKAEAAAREASEKRAADEAKALSKKETAEKKAEASDDSGTVTGTFAIDKKPE